MNLGVILNKRAANSILDIFSKHRRGAVYYWVWCNVFLASAIFSVVKIFLVTNNPLVITGYVIIIQMLNLVYFETNRVLFWTTLLLNGLSILTMEKASVFYAAIGLHQWQEHDLFRRAVARSWNRDLSDILLNAI